MSTSLQLQALAIAVDAGAPAILWGDPGIGKTQSVYSLGRALDLHVEVVIAALRDPTDFGGLPHHSRKHPPYDKNVVVKYLCKRFDLLLEEVEENFHFFLNVLGAPSTDDGVVVFAAPQWAHRLADLGKGMLFLDEISTARPAVQTALLRVVLERVVGELKLPDTIRVIAAANKPDQIAGGWDLTSPLANRFCHFDWDVDHNEWCNGFLYDWPKPDIVRLPEDWRKGLPQSKQQVVAFIQHRPELLKQLPQDEASAGRAWASPRSWTMGTELYTAARSITSDLEILKRLVRGCVGDGPAHEFFTYLDDLNLPDPEELLRNPQSNLPDRSDQLYAALGSVVHAVISSPSVERWHAAWRVLKHAADTKTVDVAVAHASVLASPAVRPKGAAVPSEVRTFVALLGKAGALDEVRKDNRHA